MAVSSIACWHVHRPPMPAVSRAQLSPSSSDSIYCAGSQLPGNSIPHNRCPWQATPPIPFSSSCSAFRTKACRNILVGGHAVRLNGFLRSTEDIDILLPSSIDNGRRVIKALNFLDGARELQPAWFATDATEPENIRVADDLLVDLLFGANGESYESLQPHVRTLEVQGVTIRTLDIEGLLKPRRCIGIKTSSIGTR